MENESLSRAEAYDIARKEFYELRHKEDIERRVAKEEALSTGAYFNKGALEVGMELEDQKYEEWREWALKEITALKQMQGSAYTGIDNADATTSFDDPATQAGFDELEPSVPGSKKGQEAYGQATMHP